MTAGYLSQLSIHPIHLLMNSHPCTTIISHYFKAQLHSYDVQGIHDILMQDAEYNEKMAPWTVYYKLINPMIHATTLESQHRMTQYDIPFF